MGTGPRTYLADPGLPHFPGARVVRQGGVGVAPRMRVRVLDAVSPLVEHAVQALGYAVALWPLTGTALLAGALLWAVGMASAP